ncbi:MAG: CsgG/HfaB family protein [Desulfovibrionaceae bacterium]|nr:hypothetical protein [Desulfovibrionaceae bacterium]MDD4951114.1 CsgG/HfaB family protein [Desulfovibrionaceae bacterium]
MNKAFCLPALAVVCLILASCVTTGTQTTVETPDQTVQEAAAYEGPRARIAVSSFKCKSANCGGEIGSGLSDMLATALFKSNRFVVLERGEGLKEIQEELALMDSGYVEAGKGPTKGSMEGADILVTGGITAFEPDAGGMGGALGAGFLGILGISGQAKEAYIAADIRLVDVRRGRVINATKVEGRASSFKLGGIGGGIIGSVPLGGALGGYKNTPMEKAVRTMLDAAINEIVKLVPESYYRYPAGK